MKYLGVFLLVGVACGELLLSNVDRTLDLSSQLAKMGHKLTFENSGSGSVKSVDFSVAPNVQDKVSFIGATVI